MVGNAKLHLRAPSKSKPQTKTGGGGGRDSVTASVFLTVMGQTVWPQALMGGGNRHLARCGRSTEAGWSKSHAPVGHRMSKHDIVKRPFFSWGFSWFFSFSPVTRVCRLSST